MYKQFIAFAAVLLLVGAGCAGADTTDTIEQDASAPTPTAVPTEQVSEAGEEPVAVSSKTAITLSAEERDGQSVAFEWNIPAGTEYDAFYLVRGEEVDPVNDGKNYWFRQYYTRRTVTWADQPAGAWHYRICGVINDECADYSNNIQLTVE